MRSKLLAVSRPAHPDGAVVVMHGGASRRGDMAVSPTQLSVLRMIPIARTIARRGRRRLAVYRLLNSARGWDTHHTPVDDALWALRTVREELGPVPVALVGHSLGGRAALLAGQDPGVDAVVALNPYLYPADGEANLSGTDVLIVHGTQDRIARLDIAAEVATRLRRRSSSVDLVRVEGGKHAMLRHHREFSDRASDFVVRVLLSPPAPGNSGSGRPA